jgi:hypothetical protein
VVVLSKYFSVLLVGNAIICKCCRSLNLAEFVKLPFRQVLIRGTTCIFGIIWNVFQNVVAQNHIVLIVFKGKLQISAFTSASGENKSVVV